VGASAGGLEFLKRLCARVPENKELSVFIAQHLEPHHQSRLPELLASQTKLEVKEAEDGEDIRGNTIYTVPASAQMSVRGNRVHLSPVPESRLQRLPIDFLFRSLAEEYRENAVGVILTGNGSDGTAGIQSINEYGGLTVAQRPVQAPFTDMPRSAINSGSVDFVLDVEDMMRSIITFVEHSSEAKADQSGVTVDVEQLLSRVNEFTGYDFSTYRRSTVRRRILRRMGLAHLESYEDYAELLDERPEELEALTRDLLVSVTRFFRNEDAFSELGRTVAEMLAEGSLADDELRVWVPGCSRGEEAYSVAMLVADKIEEAGAPTRLQVFGTDIEKQALETARRGEYGDYLRGQVPERLLNKYFEQVPNGFRVVQKIRDSVMFTEHNLLMDPPFSSIDIVSCRNVLIYLDRNVHDPLLSLFHFSLRNEGLLFLGTAEGVGASDELFARAVRGQPVYRRRAEVQPRYPQLPIQASGRRSFAARTRTGRSRERTGGPESSILRVLVSSLGLVAVAVDNTNAVRYVSGSVDGIFEIGSGQPSFSLDSLITEGISSRVMAAVRAARNSEERTDQMIRFRQGDRWRRGRMIVEPAAGEGELVILAFSLEDKGEGSEASELEREGSEEIIRSLEEELAKTKSELHETAEEMQSYNEELKSTNEEIMSMNEELQSTNEELETSKEETQSLNEELQTVNAELEDKVKALENTNEDLENLLESSDQATLFFDADRRLRRYSKKAARLFDVLPSDVGNPLASLSPKLLNSLDFSRIDSAFDSAAPHQVEVEVPDEGSHLLRVLPFRRMSGESAGVVISVTDVNMLKDTQSRLTGAVKRYKSLAENSPDMIIRLTADGRVKYANSHFETLGGGSAEEATGRLLEELDLPSRLTEPWKKAISECLADGAVHRQLIDVTDDRGERRTFDWTVIPEPAGDDEEATALTVGRDVTETERVKESLEDALSDREVLIRDVHHRVKTNLFMLNGLLFMEREKLREEFSQPGPALESLNKTMRRVEVISAIYSYLYQHSGNAEFVEAREFINGLVDLVRKAHAERKVALTVNCASMRISIDTAVPLSLVISEALTNAYRHAFAAEGSIELTLEAAADDWAKLSIRDDGVGITNAEEELRSGGLELMRTLLRQIKGEIELRVDGGTEISVRFPTNLWRTS
jgi:two-component system CheB/CheR fusion protein